MSVAANYENFADGGVILWGYEAMFVDGEKYAYAEIIGYCRGPDPNSNVAYQLGDPGAGTGSQRNPGEGTGV